MPLFDNLKNAWSALWSKSGGPPGAYGAGYGGGSTWSDGFKFRRGPTPNELVEAYKSICYCCVNLNANGVARTPLRLYATTKGGQHQPKCGTKSVGRLTKERLRKANYASKAMANAEEIEEVTDHPLLDAVMKVNEDLDYIQLLTYTVMSLDIVGDAYWWPSLGQYKIPDEIWALPPHLVMPIFASASMVPDYYTFGGFNYPKSDLIRFRSLSAKNPYGKGYGPLQAAVEYARLEDVWVSAQDDMLSNGPRPSLIVSHRDPQGAFGPAERKRLEDDLNRKSRGGRAGASLVVDGAATVTPVSYTPTDLGGLQVAGNDLERIANCFDVPVSMLKTEDVNKANAEAGLEQHGRNAIDPRCKLIASTLTRWTHAQDAKGARGWDRLLWAFDPAVNADKVAEADLHAKYFAMGLPPNVALTEAGYDAVEGGDTSFIASGFVTLEAALKPPEPPPVPGQAPGEDPENPDGEADPEARDDTWDESHSEATDEAPTGDEDDDGEESKALDATIHTKIAKSLADIEEKRLTLGHADDEWLDDLGIEYYWDPILKRATPCRDNRGRFASCGTGGGAAKPKPGDKKPAASSGRKPKEPKPKKPAKDPKPANPAKEPKKPKDAKKPAEKPAKPEAKPKPEEKPAKEKPAAEKPDKKPQEKPKPPEEKPEPEAAKPKAEPSATGTNFGESKAKIASDPSLTPAEAKAYQDKAKHIIGPGATDADIANIVGAPDNAKVTLADGALYGHANAMVLQTKSDDMQSLRFIKRDKNGDLVIKNEFIMVEGKKGTGIGTKVFGRQVEQAVRLGATKITAEASRSMGMNGYITWPKLGYDAPIPASVVGGLPASLKGSKNVSDLMKTPEGTEWWTKNGVTTDMTFDLKEGSHSRKHLAAYLERKGVTQ